MGGAVDKIIRIDPASGAVLSWAIPGGGLHGSHDSSQTNDGIEIDGEGNVWFTETDGDQIGRLDGGGDGIIGTADDVICEYSKTDPGGASLPNEPQQITTGGTGSLLQASWTERSGNAVGILTEDDATPTCTIVPAVSELVVIDDETVVPYDFEEEDGALGCPCGTCHSPDTNTIIPTTHDIPGIDPSGIRRFSIANATPTIPVINSLTGMTRLIGTGTLAGSAWENHFTFVLEAPDAIVAPFEPPDDLCPEVPGTRTLGFYKNHPWVVGGALDVEEGDPLIAETIAIIEDRSDHRSRLRSQLTVTKLNVAVFGIGGCTLGSLGIVPPGSTLPPNGDKTVDEVIAEAEALLADPDVTKDELSAMQDLLDAINNSHDDTPLPPPFDDLAKHKVDKGEKPAKKKKK